MDIGLRVAGYWFLTMIGLLGKKIGMTQIFNEEGRQIPITVLKVGPCRVTALRTKEKHGYSAVQLGFDSVKEKKLNRAKAGYLKKVNVGPVKFLKEIRTEDLGGLKIGQELGADQFEVGDFVDVEGTSIGKGFQGVVKRHHFKGSASKSHGSMFGRVPGSIGASSFPSRVVKGMRAAGHMGQDQVTVQSLKVVKVDAGNHLLAVRGAVPGVEGGYLLVRAALKKKGPRRKWKITASEEPSKEPSASPSPAEYGQEAESESSEKKA